MWPVQALWQFESLVPHDGSARNDKCKVGLASAREEKEKTEAGEARHLREPEEKRSANQKEQKEEENDLGEERGKGFIGEMPIQPRPLDERTRHVSGGVWLSQVRSCL
ncbi:hypothetical protein NDU88_003602 [Pleurodeles waltl]|uniref:Uncharacterized protein n=1 Tax=Pleurodeles waltl TaxID=8319 RepID=A0AAV7T6N6_PLEWA|nr:hypothetical protein NDU88_003602 [Pleurodeles waltl]